MIFDDLCVHLLQNILLYGFCNLDFSRESNTPDQCPNLCGFCNEDCSAGDLWIPAQASQLTNGEGMVHYNQWTSSCLKSFSDLSN